ncbi:hypothetical protein [Reyranella sp.]|uniref:hypothetical protein n=1 Tax=Reyranella sp. TaxID=1929291 RepID=UPI003F72DF3E
MTAFAEWRGWRLVSAVLAVLVGFYFVFFAVTRPALDWDVVGYTMAVLKPAAMTADGSIDVVALHERSWSAVKPHLSPAALAYLTTGSSYSEAQHLDPRALISQLPLYEIKYGYILVLKSVTLALEPVRAIVMVSLVGALGILALLVQGAWRLDGIATLGWLPLVLLFGLGSFASMVSPDAIFAFACVAGIAALLAERVWLAVACFLLAVLLRPDGIILNVVLSGVLAVRRENRAALVLLLGSVAAAAVAYYAGRHIGGWAQFHFKIVGPQNVLTDFDPAFDPNLYFRILLTQIGTVSHLSWVHAAVAAVLTAILLLGRPASGRWASLLLGALLVAAGVRFLLYPSSEIRFYIPHLFGIGLIILYAAQARPRPAAAA